MKIHLHLSNLDPGGAQKVMTDLANTWQDQGHQMSVSANTISGFWRSNIAQEVDVHDLDAGNFLTAIPALRRVLKQNTPDILLSAMTQANFTAVIAGKLSQTPVVISERHHTSTWMARLSPRKRVLYRSLLPFLYARADKCIALTQHAAEDLCTVAGLQQDAVSVIPNPIPQMPKLQPTAPHPWLEDPNIPVVVGVGRLAPQKDFETLIRSIATLRKQRVVRLIILGDGALRPLLEEVSRSEGLQECVVFPGQVRNVQDYLSRANAYCLSSNFEGFPNTLLEALSLGVPVVSTDCPTGPKDILDNGTYGRLVPIGDPEAMAHALSQVFDQPDDSAKLRNRAAEFDLKSISERYLDVLKSAQKTQG